MGMSDSVDFDQTGKFVLGRGRNLSCLFSLKKKTQKNTK